MDKELTDYLLDTNILIYYWKGEIPSSQIKNIEEIEVGRDGIYLERGPCRGLLLPQVATEYGWDRHTFLQQTSVKAGLPPDAWEDPQARIFIFSAKVLHEPPKK